MATPLDQVQQQFRQLFGRGPTAGDVGAFNEISARVANQGSSLPQQAVAQTQPTNQAAAGTGPNNIFDLAKSIGAPAVVSGENVLSVNSKDFARQPIVQQAPQVQSFQEALNTIQNQFRPLDEERINQIRSGVEAQFAPQFAEQQRVNDLRATLERAGAAQRGGVGFGGNVGRLNVGAQTQVAQAGADALNRLQGLKEAEIQARIQAAQTQDFEKQKTFIQQAQDLQQQQRQALRDFQDAQFREQSLGLQREGLGLDILRENRIGQGQEFQQAQQRLGFLSELDDRAFEQLPEANKFALESSLGLPAGFVDSLRMTKEFARNAKDDAAVSNIYNMGTKLALDIPQGQTFNLRTGTGEELTFVGTAPDEVQIVSNSKGIFRVNKSTGNVEQVVKFSSSGGGSGNESDTLAATLAAQVLSTTGGDGFVNTEAYRQAREMAAQLDPKVVSSLDKLLPPETFLNTQDPTARRFLFTKSSALRDGEVEDDELLFTDNNSKTG